MKTQFPISVYSKTGRGKYLFSFILNWSGKIFSVNKVVVYGLEMSNKYSPLQYVPERGGAKIYFLKHWYRKKLPGNKVVGYCLEMPNQLGPGPNKV